MAASRAAVLGSPVAHSLSPVLHAAAYRELGLDDWSYQAIECDERGLAGLLGSLGPDWAGLSLTMPLKRAVLPLLDQAEQLVTDVGAANTVVLRDGRRLGFNTDVAGMLTALRQAGVTPEGNVVILGGGATACSAVAAMAAAGASGVAVAVRDPARAAAVQAVAGRLGMPARLIDLSADLRREPWQLLISTIPAAAARQAADGLTAGVLAAGAVLDVIYDPWPTPLAQAAASSGRTVISGYEMLLHQAAGQLELMTGRPAPVAAMRAAGLAELARRAQAGRAR